MHGIRERRAVQLAWIFWAILLVWVSLGPALGSKRTVVHNYRRAAACWVSAEPLYKADGAGFLYLPQAAVLSIPLCWGPVTLGETLWRIVSLSLLATAVSRFARTAGRDADTDLFPLTTLVAIPLSFSSAQNGQSTIIMTAAMLLSVVSVADRCWWRATFWICLGVALKPLAIVLALLIGALHKPMRLRMVAGCLFVVLFPFGTQEFDYVRAQYAAFPVMLKTAAAGGQSAFWAQAFDALQLVGVSVSSPIQTVVRVLAAAGVLSWCWVVNRREDAPQSAVWLFALAATYVVLFSPRTENCTYALVAPAIGVFFARAWGSERNPMIGAFLGLIALGTVGSYEFGRLVTPKEQSIWLAPLMSTCFLAYLAVTTFQNVRDRSGGLLQSITRSQSQTAVQQGTGSGRQAA